MTFLLLGSGCACHCCTAACEHGADGLLYLGPRFILSLGIVSGAITGLVVITPAAGYVDWTAAFVSGLIGAVLCYALLLLKNKLKLDEKPNECDCPDAFGVHAIGGIVGALLLVRPVCFVCTSMKPPIFSLCVCSPWSGIRHQLTLRVRRDSSPTPRSAAPLSLESFTSFRAMAIQTAGSSAGRLWASSSPLLTQRP